MAIEPLIRTRDRLTNKNFIDAEQWDFEFNKFATYINTKLLPVLNTLFDMQVLASNIPADINGYLYEDENSNLTWKKPSDAALLLNYLEPPIYGIAFVGQKQGENHLSYLQANYINDGIVFCKDTTSFDIKKLINNNLSNDFFDDSNFVRNNITIDKLNDYNSLIVLTPTPRKNYWYSAREFLSQNFSDIDGKFTFDYIEDGGLKSSSSYQGQLREDSLGALYSKLNTHCRLLPEGLFGANGRWQLNEYKVSFQAFAYTRIYPDPSAYESGYTTEYYANFHTLAPFYPINQALYDDTDYAKNEIFRDNEFSVLPLSLAPPLDTSFGSKGEEQWLKMNIPARCFADKSVGIQGNHYDYICFWQGDTKYVGCLPETNNYDYNVAPLYNVYNLLDKDITVDYIEDDIIDIAFFPKRIQDKINAHP